LCPPTSPHGVKAQKVNIDTLRQKEFKGFVEKAQNIKYFK
jgi:hypothetical protein